MKEDHEEGQLRPLKGPMKVKRAKREMRKRGRRDVRLWLRRLKRKGGPLSLF